MAPLLSDEPMMSRRTIKEGSIGTGIDINTRRFTTNNYVPIISETIEYGVRYSPRGEPTYERIWWNGYMPSPRARVVRNPARKLNAGFAIVEWLSTMTGRDELKLFTPFISEYGRYSTDGTKLDGCYGTRIRYADDFGDIVSQFEQCEDKLLEDMHTRQAVVAIYQREDLSGLGGKNTPCSLNLQFLARKGNLSLIANMRSNDVVLGFPYDIFNFTMIQEFMARRLGLAVSEYMHNVGSFHVYERDMPMVGRMMLAHEEGLDFGRNWAMPAMPRFEYDDLELILDTFLDLMERPRTLELVLPTLHFSSRHATQYGSYLLSVMLTWAYHKVDPYLQQDAFNWIPQDYTFDQLAVDRFNLDITKRQEHHLSILSRRRRGRTRRLTRGARLAASREIMSRREMIEIPEEDDEE